MALKPDESDRKPDTTLKAHEAEVQGDDHRHVLDGIYIPQDNASVQFIQAPTEQPNKPPEKTPPPAQALKPLERLMNDAFFGQFTDEAKRIWKEAFVEAIKQPNASAESVEITIKNMAKKINDYNKSIGTKHELNMELAIVTDQTGNKFEKIFLSVDDLDKPPSEKQATEMMQKGDTKTFFEVGTMLIPPPGAIPPKPKSSTGPI